VGERQRYRRNYDFLESYTANVSNKDTTEGTDFEAVAVAGTSQTDFKN
jgi:hypothetical protein